MDDFDEFLLAAEGEEAGFTPESAVFGGGEEAELVSFADAMKDFLEDEDYAQGALASLIEKKEEAEGAEITPLEGILAEKARRKKKREKKEAREREEPLHLLASLVDKHEPAEGPEIQAVDGEVALVDLVESRRPARKKKKKRQEGVQIEAQLEAETHDAEGDEIVGDVPDVAADADVDLDVPDSDFMSLGVGGVYVSRQEVE